MSQSIVYILLICALALPTAGALGLRVLAGRLTPPQLYGAAAGVFAVAIVSVLLLVRSDVPSLQIGRLSILLPVSAPGDQPPDLPAVDLPTSPPPDQAPAATAMPTEPAPAAPTELVPSATPEPTSAPAPTEVPTDPPAPSATPEPTAAPTDTPAPTTLPAPSGQRRYVVQPGDTLRTIAEQFNVSVQAIIDVNRLTPEQADSLQVGQELVIP